MESSEDKEPKRFDEPLFWAIVVLAVPIIAILGINAYALSVPLRTAFLWDLFRLPIIVLCLFCLFWRRVRFAMLCVIAAVLLMTAWYWRQQGERHLAVRAYLESCYDHIAQRGTPFPKSLPVELKDGPTSVRWYYQQNSDSSFGIVYIIGSDGNVLHYPDKIWKRIGYFPEKYDPAELDRYNAR